MQTLASLKKLDVWKGAPIKGKTLYDIAVNDENVKKALHVLRRATEGAQKRVATYFTSFEPFSFLWRKDLASEYAAFMAKNPQLEVG